jgi:hypothetical protein
MSVNEILIYCPDSDNSVCNHLTFVLFFTSGSLWPSEFRDQRQKKCPHPILIIKKTDENLCPCLRVYFYITLYSPF